MTGLTNSHPGLDVDTFLADLSTNEKEALDLISAVNGTLYYYFHNTVSNCLQDWEQCLQCLKVLGKTITHKDVISALSLTSSQHADVTSALRLTGNQQADAARTKILNHHIRVIEHEVTERQKALWAHTCDQVILNITNHNPPLLDTDPKL
jgi:hypothetical protein